METRQINPDSFYEREPDGTMCEKCSNYFPEEKTIVAYLSKNNAWTLCHPCYDRWLDGETENDERIINQKKLNKMNETKSSLLHPLFADIVKSFSNPTTMKTEKTLHEFIEDLDNFNAVVFEQQEAEQVINFILSFRKDMRITVESTDDGRVKITKL